MLYTTVGSFGEGAYSVREACACLRNLKVFTIMLQGKQEVVAFFMTVRAEVVMDNARLCEDSMDLRRLHSLLPSSERVCRRF